MNKLYTCFVMELFFISLIIFPLLLKQSIAIPLVPTPGKCEDNYITVFPPRLMNTWHVIKHTDSLLPPMPSCVVMKFGRRINFNSQLRIDIINSVKGEVSDMQVTLPPVRGDITVKADEPLSVDIPLMSLVFPKNIMVTDFDEENKCMAFWSCAETLPSVSIRGAWVLCQSTDVDEAVIDKLEESVASKSNISPRLFTKTKYDSCV